jgi:hypothetical protein
MALCNCCGIRFGWSSLIGIIPGYATNHFWKCAHAKLIFHSIGDVLDAMMAMMVLRTCKQVEGGLPADVTWRMYLNIIIDFGIGLVPILGDIADAMWRANTKNAAVLEKHLRQKGAAALKAHGQAMPAIDPSDPDEYDKHMIEQHGPPPEYSAGPAQQSRQLQISQPPQARVAEERRSGGGWFGFGGKSKQRDVEAGDFRW